VSSLFLSSSRTSERARITGGNCQCRRYITLWTYLDSPGVSVLFSKGKLDLPLSGKCGSEENGRARIKRRGEDGGAKKKWESSIGDIRSSRDVGAGHQRQATCGTAPQNFDQENRRFSSLAGRAAGGGEAERARLLGVIGG
jgi:hypothetical protein